VHNLWQGIRLSHSIMGHESGHAISIQNCYLWFGHFSKHHNDHQEESTNEQGYERRRDEEE